MDKIYFVSLKSTNFGSNAQCSELTTLASRNYEIKKGKYNK